MSIAPQGDHLTRKSLFLSGSPSLRSLYLSQSPQVPQIFRDAMNIRVGVFCDEQGCSVVNEVDQDDERSWHWVAYDLSPPPPPPASCSTCSSSTCTSSTSSTCTSTSSSTSTSTSAANRAIACLRLVPPPHPRHANGFEEDPAEEAKPYLQLGRMAVVREARGRGWARWLCEEALGWAVQNGGRIGKGWEGLVLVHAQSQAQGAWERLGFKADGRLGRWHEEGIEHLGMWRQLDMRPPVQ